MLSERKKHDRERRAHRRIYEAQLHANNRARILAERAAMEARWAPPARRGATSVPARTPEAMLAAAFAAEGRDFAQPVARVQLS